MMKTEKIKLMNEETPFENVDVNPQDIIIATDEGMNIAEYQNGEIKILGVEEAIGENSRAMTVVNMEMEGEQALLIDINQDDMIFATDDIQAIDLEQNMMEIAGLYYTHQDDLQDYTNDVDSAFM